MNTEGDPTVPEWAKQPTKPTYTLEELGAEAVGSAANAILEANNYTDQRLNVLLEGADPSYNTFKELGDAILQHNLSISTITKSISNIETSLDTKADKSELFSKDYNDLTNTPEIPSIEGLASQEWVRQQIEGIPAPDLSSYALKSEIPDVSIYVEKVAGMGLSSNDFTYNEKRKLETLNNYDDSEIQNKVSEIKAITDNVYTLVNNTLFSSDNILDNFTDIDEAKNFLIKLYNSYIISIEYTRGTFVNVYSKTIQDYEDINEVRTINVTLCAQVNLSQDLKLTFNLVDVDNVFTLTKEYISLDNINKYIQSESGDYIQLESGNYIMVE